MPPAPPPADDATPMVLVETRRDGDLTIVTPHGEIDLATVDTFREALNELIIHGDVRLLVDLDHVTFIDSMGFGALVAARRKAHTFKGSVGVVCRNPRILRLFEVTGLDRVFTILPAVPTAVAPVVDPPALPA